MTSPTHSQPQLLIVDDEKALMTALCDTLRVEGYDATGFSSAADAMAALRQHDFDVLLTDMQMPEMDGMSLLREALAIDPHVMVIMMTGHATIETAVEAMKLGAFDYVQKPLKLRDLLPVLGRALELRQLRRENLQLREVAGAYELSVAIGSILDPGGILDKVLDVTVKHFDADEASIVLPTEDGKELQVAAACGPRRELMLGQRMARNAGIAGWVACHREALIVHGPVNDPRFTPAFPHEDICSAMIAPMMVAGECVGVVNVNSTQVQRAFSPGQLKALQLLAGPAASALQAARLHARLRDSEQRIRELTENLPTVLWMTNGDARKILYVNPAYEKVWGRSLQSLYENGQSWIDPIHPDDRADVLARMEQLVNGQTTTCSYRLLLADGSTRYVRDNGFPIRDESGRLVRIVGYAEDVTEQKRLESQLLQSQKMEAFGQLAGGVAHDFNNLVTVITGFSELILSGVVPPEQRNEIIGEIRKAGERAGSLTRQLLAFSRKQILEPVVLDLNRLVREMEKMLRRLISEDISLATALDPDLGQVKADPGQLEQVIMNLVVNARDAMPRGGRLTIETKNVELDEHYARSHGGAHAGRYVLLAVSDTGCGMDEATKAKIFEPFFTTKGAGKGTGLGLATVHGIVKQSGGSIEVYSEVGHGTSFKIYLPRAGASASRGRLQADLSLLPRGSETILLTEDEEAVRNTFRIALESQGYTVLPAKDAEEALAICRQYPGPIHLLMTDVVMPKVGGRQLADSVVQRRPDIKVLYLSGYTDDAVIRHGVLQAGMAFLQKPFTLIHLTRKVREVLDGKKPE